MRKVKLTEREAALVGRLVDRELRHGIFERKRIKANLTISTPDGPVISRDEADFATYEYIDNTVKTLYQIKDKLEREDE